MAKMSFTTTRKDFDLISKIADRALSSLPWPDDKMTLIMDLTACHANGNPLKLAELLEAPAGDFAHDLSGIRWHINRETGALEDCFSPRFSVA